MAVNQKLRMLCMFLLFFILTTKGYLYFPWIYVIVIQLIYCTHTQVHVRKGGVYATLTPHEIKHLTVLYN